MLKLDLKFCRIQNENISQIKSSVQASGGTVSSNNAYIYDMMGNMTRKFGTGAEAWFSYDENGRMLTQDDATGHMAYHYAPKSYRVTEVSGKIGLDRSRDASSKNNFVYDASGRVVGDASKNLAIEYDMSGLPVLFTVKDGSDLYHAINVYDPQGWRVGVLEYTNNVLQSLRTDIMVDGKKELERRRDMVHATEATASQPSVSEYKMLYGAAGVLGRENAGGGREWYVKDYQGSLVMTIVNDAVGNVIAYEPYGSQKLLQANGDMPSEQYTGKEYVGRLGLYYFGARFFDPTFAMWLTPDPAGQYLNPYSYGGDPVNAVDLDGRWSWKSIGKGALAVAGLGVAVGVAPAVALDAGMTVDAMAGGTLSLGMLGLSATPAMFTGPASSYLSGGNMNDIGNSFVNGLFMDALGGVASASAMMTTLSHVQRCGYGEDCTKVARDVFHGGFFVDNVGNMIGLGNVKFMGGTADWFELRDINSDWDGVSDYYQGNVVYSRGYLDVVKNFGISGGGDHLGHAVMAVDCENKETIAHELNHVRQTENIGYRWLYLFNYLDNNGWSPFPNDAYYSNKMEMDSYYKAFLYKNGCIDVYGNEIGEWTHEEMSRAFYKGGQYTVNGFTYNRSEGDSYSHKHPEVVYDDWFWYENWWKDY